MPIITPKQAKFIEVYAATLDTVRSAKEAGYTSTREARRLLKKKHVLDAINTQMKSKGINIEPTIPRILQELMRIAFFDPKDLYYDDGTPKALTEISEDARRCIVGIEFALEGKGEDAVTIKKYKIADKHKALENLGRHLAMFTDKMKVDVNTELQNMNDEQLTDTIRSLAAATGISLSPASSSKTKH